MCLNETYSSVWVGRHFTFPIKNGLKQGDALSPLFFNYASQYSIRRIQVNQNGLKLNGTYQLLLYAHDTLGGSLHTINITPEALTVASKDSELEINADKTKYVVMFQDLNAGWSK